MKSISVLATVSSNAAAVRDNSVSVYYWKGKNMMMNAGSETEKWFTEIELRKYDGEDLPMYIAYQGIVYDVTDCPKWRLGMHESVHFPGIDLSSEIADAPHKDDVLQRPCVKRVGQLRI